MLEPLKPSFDPSISYAPSNTSSTSLAGGSGKPGSGTFDPADVVMWRGSETKMQTWRDMRRREKTLIEAYKYPGAQASGAESSRATPH